MALKCQKSIIQINSKLQATKTTFQTENQPNLSTSTDSRQMAQTLASSAPNQPNFNGENVTNLINLTENKWKNLTPFLPCDFKMIWKLWRKKFNSASEQKLTQRFYLFLLGGQQTNQWLDIMIDVFYWQQQMNGST